MSSPVAADEPMISPDHVWRTVKADRVGVLMENDTYFRALESSLRKARRSVTILGWQFDPRTRLDAESRAGDRQAEIGHMLRLMVKSNPDLDVRLLIWKSPVLIAASQGFYPHRAQAWFRKRLVEFRLDQPPLIGACHHQKVVVIDDRIAFVGGGDISTDRWDSEAHLDDDPRRCMPSGTFSAPRHETMCVVDGEAARALGDLARERWFRATWERVLPDEVEEDPWPDGVEPQLRDCPMSIARTVPKTRGRALVRESEALHLDLIGRARKLIYLENQYFTSPDIAQALARRLAEPDGPEVVLITTGGAPSWFDKMTMDTARSEVLYRLEQADRYNRFFAFAPRTRDGDTIIVHAKVSIIDDQVLRIGSTNLNNRSMGLDTECDVAFEPTDERGREAIRAHRLHGIAHFVGIKPSEAATAEAVLGSVGRAIQTFDSGRMTALGATPPSPIERFIAEWQLGDPRGADDIWRPWKRRNPSQRRLAPPVDQLNRPMA